MSGGVLKLQSGEDYLRAAALEPGERSASFADAIAGFALSDDPAVEP